MSEQCRACRPDEECQVHLHQEAVDRPSLITDSKDAITPLLSLFTLFYSFIIWIRLLKLTLAKMNQFVYLELER